MPGAADSGIMHGPFQFAWLFLTLFTGMWVSKKKDGYQERASALRVNAWNLPSLPTGLLIKCLQNLFPKTPDHANKHPVSLDAERGKKFLKSRWCESPKTSYNS
jgi:hypothetical protein